MMVLLLPHPLENFSSSVMCQTHKILQARSWVFQRTVQMYSDGLFLYQVVRQL